MARHEIHMEKYAKILHIEASTLIDMVQHGVLPAVSEYVSTLCETISRKQAILPAHTCAVENSLAGTLSELNDELLEKTVALKTVIETVSPGASPEELLAYYSGMVLPAMNEVRALVDKLETLTASDYWPYPTYYDLLFSV